MKPGARERGEFFRQQRAKAIEPGVPSRLDATCLGV
jgi:hypothetical protein